MSVYSYMPGHAALQVLRDETAVDLVSFADKFCLKDFVSQS